MSEEIMNIGSEEGDQVLELDINRLRTFKNHPFKVTADMSMVELKDSIEKYGILNPLIVRPVPEGYYEIISGHRRKFAAKQLGYTKVPVIIKVMKNDEAIVAMVDSNLQRETILPSERAFAYKMKYDAIKRQGERTDLTSCQVGTKLRADQKLAVGTGDSARTVQRYMRLTELNPKLLDMVDNKQIAFNPAVELSYLTQEEQENFLEAMDYSQNTPSLSQAQRIKKLSQEKKCTLEAMCAVMNETKKEELDKVTINNEVLRKYFPRSYTPKQMQDTIIKLLENWHKKRQKNMER